MADTKHSHAGSSHSGSIPVESDGISYRGIVWFVVVLVVTTGASQVLMALLFSYLDRAEIRSGPTRNPLSAPVGQLPPPPNLVTDEPGNLERLRETDDKKLSTYQWIDKNAGTVRIPIDRAKELLLQRGLPVGPAPAAAPAAAGKTAEPAAKGKSSP